MKIYKFKTVKREIIIYIKFRHSESNLITLSYSIFDADMSKN